MDSSPIAQLVTPKISSAYYLCPAGPCDTLSSSDITCARPCRLSDYVRLFMSATAQGASRIPSVSTHVRHGYSCLTGWLCTTIHIYPLISDSSQSLFYVLSLKTFIIPMPRAPTTLKRSRRLSKEGSTDNAPAQSAYFDEQPLPEKDAIRPANDEIVNILKQVLDVLKDSTVASKIGKDDRSRFWAAYKRVAEEHDEEFLERHNSDMDVVLIFSGLFSTISTAFIVAMESNLSPDPNDTTHALLAQLVQIGFGNFTAAGSTPAAPASTWSPSAANIRIQSIAYASLSFSLLAAFGAVLGKQWLGYYKSHRYGRGSEDERGKRRQEKFDGIVTWYFDAVVVQSFPILLQFSIFLFGIALGANMWYEQYTIAWVIIAATVFRFLFYSLTVMAALVSLACPFQTPISTILRVDELLRPIFIRASQYLEQSN
ncbi:hypothetical protein BDR03DRAFT_400608 [Suillus americanus]|nr:hypothetical protein BDR03DRAFT_400608 [Suillus americanus]